MLKTRAGDIIGNMPDDVRFLRRPEVEHLTGLSKSAIYQRMAEGRFPEARTLRPQVRCFGSTGNTRLVRGRVAERDEAAA